MSEIENVNPCPPGHRLVRPVWVILGLQVIAVLLLAMIAMQRASHEKALGWEYKLEQISDQGFADRLNTLGRQGWELVSSRKTDDSQGGGYELVLKRPAGD
jgi:hypothetical protein